MATTKVIRLKRWRIDVLTDTPNQEDVIYTVIAADELDARIIAFCLDGGFGTTMLTMRHGDIELVKSYTKVLEVSSA